MLKMLGFREVLGGSWVVLNGVISPLIWVILTVTLLITPVITTHAPPSRGPSIRAFRRGRVDLKSLHSAWAL